MNAMKPVLLALALLLGLAPSAYGYSGSADPGPLPDLTVRREVLAEQWVVRDEDLPGFLCSVQEAGITPGVHTILRFTVMTPNVGTADLSLGDPNAHVAADDGLYEFATCHNHYHFRHYAQYQLIDPGTGRVWRTAKRGFCMVDSSPAPAYLGQAPRDPQFRTCGAVGVPGNQGISAGWADTYALWLNGQYFVLDGGDGQAPVPPGDYLLRVTVNPGFKPAAGEPCPHRDTKRLCHQLPESDYENNVAEVAITIPAHPGRTGTGPAAGTPAPADFDAAEH